MTRILTRYRVSPENGSPATCDTDIKFDWKCVHWWNIFMTHAVAYIPFIYIFFIYLWLKWKYIFFIILPQKYFSFIIINIYQNFQKNAKNRVHFFQALIAWTTRRGGRWEDKTNRILTTKITLNIFGIVICLSYSVDLRLPYK